MKTGKSFATGVLSKAEWVLALALTLFSIVLHFHWKQCAGGLWRDEVGTLQFATMNSWSEIWKNLAYDNFPPLVLLFLRAWHGLGLAQDDAGWRNFGLLVGLLFLILIWLVSRWLALRPPLLILAIAVANPLAVRTLDTLRPYGLGIWWMVATFAAFGKAAEKLRLRWTVLAAVCATLAVQTLYQNAVFIFALVCGGTFLSWHRKSAQTLWHLLAASTVAALSLLPHLGHLRAGQESGVVAQMPVDLGYLFSVTASALAEDGLVCLWLFPAAVLLGLAWMFFHKSSSGGVPAAGLAWSLIPTLLIGVGCYYLFLLATKLPTQPWYYVIVFAFAALVIDAYVRVDSSSAFRWCRLGLVIVLTLGSIPAAWDGTKLRMTNVDLLAADATNTAAREDLILISPWEAALTWQYYYRGDAPWQSIPPLSDNKIHRYDLIKQWMVQSDQSAVMAPTLQAIRDTLQSGHRVWLIGGLPSLAPGQSLSPLPPAPQSPYGWWHGAYESCWTYQTGTFLKMHALSGTVVQRPLSTPTNAFENLPMFLVSGWRD